MAEKKFKWFHILNVEKTEEDYETKILKVKNLENKVEEISIYSKRAYEKEVTEDNDTIEVGCVKPWQKYDKDRKKTIGCAQTNPEQEKCVHLNVYKKKPLFIQGYASVGQNRYLYVAKRPILLFIILGIFSLALLGFGILNLLPKEVIPEQIIELLPIENAEDWDGEYAKGESTEAIAEQTEIPGYANLFVSKDSPNIPLINPENNTVYFKYVIKEGDTIIYETNLIEPNKMVNANLYDILIVGEHELTFHISTYDINTQVGCNGATQTVSIIKR